MSNGISPFYLVFLLQRKIIFLFDPEGEDFFWSTEEKDFKCLVLLSRFFFVIAEFPHFTYLLVQYRLIQVIFLGIIWL